MKKHTTHWSLARQQWLGLAALSLLGLALVSCVVYAMTAGHLQARQQESLQNMSRLVSHLLQEQSADKTTGEASDVSALLTRLDEHFSGHADLALNIWDEKGQLRYRSQHQLPAAQAASWDFAVAAPLATGGSWHARLQQDQKPDAQLLRQLRWILLASSLMGVAVFAFGGLWLIRRLLRPLAALQRQVQGLDIGQLTQRLDATEQPEELQALVQQFNALLQRIQAAYAQLDGFNADVAHELNTPLATLITSTELALRKPREAQALLELLGVQLEELQRVSAMVKDMLFLAQADRGAKARRSPVASLRALAQSVADYHEATFAEAELELLIVGEASGNFDPPLLKRALSNLLSNACRYALPGSLVEIRIAPLEPNQVRLSVSNLSSSGTEIKPQDLPRIFDRLYRSDSARSQPGSHHGLGLSIVAAVARMHAGQPLAHSAAGQTEVGMVLRIL
ncbi:MAG: heavy metal sensor histidine kinase [Brachymonas sp.]